MEEKLEYIKFRERFDWALNLIKEKAKQENLPFTESLFREASEISRMLFVRSEISYSGRKA